MNLKELIERQQALIDGAKNAGREMNDEEKQFRWVLKQLNQYYSK